MSAPFTVSLWIRRGEGFASTSLMPGDLIDVTNQTTGAVTLCVWRGADRLLTKGGSDDKELISTEPLFEHEIEEKFIAPWVRECRLRCTRAPAPHGPVRTETFTFLVEHPLRETS